MKALLRHGKRDVTALYSDADVQNLILAVEKIVKISTTVFLRKLK